MNRSALSTLVELIGIASVVIGVASLSMPVSFIVGGVLLMLLGTALGKAEK